MNYTMKVEIPAGSITRYNFDEKGRLKVKHFQSMPVSYPANYGYIDETLADDGAEADVLVITREPLLPATYIDIKVIGYIDMTDGGEKDEKFIAVPVEDVDPTYAEINSVFDLPKAELDRIYAFYSVYKQLPEGRKTVELNGYKDEHLAKELLGIAQQRFSSAK
ncbi:inorganic diphosphatase [Vibrio superstes]|uniref:inorganic diphosphatase n=1 Tax=Vibrio superstes NBRC 103154 TaxID=1219062 RepID=A0A511QNH7_9VIBR|nr:inorganic diphosphatase [Vibrio superstes]GEM78889.1 inorganic pyrophosphatase [Vibrio superstes NBRC 103154]